jgi:hypothetical protein
MKKLQMHDENLSFVLAENLESLCGSYYNRERKTSRRPSGTSGEIGEDHYHGKEEH